MHLYLVRHTQPDVPTGTCYGQTDVDVASSFAAELQAVQAKLAHLESATLYTSPLRRCRQLAEAFQHLGPLHHEPRIMELNFGDWEMQRWDTIPSGVIESWAEDHVVRAPPNGESFQTLSERCNHFFQELTQSSVPMANDQAVVLFTHAGVIRALLSQFLGMPLHHAFRLQVDYGGVTRLYCAEPAPALVRFNV